MAAFDEALMGQGFLPAGLDEAGRGPLAGPVCAACVVLPPGCGILGIDDSKKLGASRRAALYAQIKQDALYCQAAFASVEEIEALNILQATKLAMLRAAVGLADLYRNSTAHAVLLIDALELPGLPFPQRAIVRGDATSRAIAAASIIAKETRDAYMLELDAQYPRYGFAKHKGYGTAWHLQMLREHGACAAHRASFLHS